MYSSFYMFEIIRFTFYITIIILRKCHFTNKILKQRIYIWMIVMTQWGKGGWIWVREIFESFVETKHSSVICFNKMTMLWYLMKNYCYKFWYTEGMYKFVLSLDGFNHNVINLKRLTYISQHNANVVLV